MTYTLRPYQDKAATIGVYHLKNYSHPFAEQLATGAGKSLIIAEVCHRLGEPTLILQPSKELLEQNYAKLESYGIDDIGIYSASAGRKEIAKYTYATINSIYKKPELFQHFRYVIIDECHGVNPKNLEGMYTSFLDAIGCRNVMGLTATPYRVVPMWTRDQGELIYTATLKMINRITRTPFFKKIVFTMETDELIEQGYLCPIKYHVDPIVLDGLVVNSTGADFTTDSLERFWTNQKLERLAKIIQVIDQHAKRNLIFCSSVTQAVRTKDMLAHMGIMAEVVTGKTPIKKREAIVNRFKSGELKHLINVGVFTTGFDVPELNSIVLARPTMSLALYYQMVGRGVRLDPADPNKVLRVFDVAGVVERMGRVEAIKLGKEPHKTIKDFYLDTIEGEFGRMDNKPLFSFKVKKEMFKKKASDHEKAPQV